MFPQRRLPRPRRPDRQECAGCDSGYQHHKHRRGAATFQGTLAFIADSLALCLIDDEGIAPQVLLQDADSLIRRTP